MSVDDLMARLAQADAKKEAAVNEPVEFPEAEFDPIRHIASIVDKFNLDLKVRQIPDFAHALAEKFIVRWGNVNLEYGRKSSEPEAIELGDLGYTYVTMVAGHDYWKLRDVKFNVKGKRTQHNDQDLALRLFPHKVDKKSLQETQPLQYTTFDPRAILIAGKFIDVIGVENIEYIEDNEDLFHALAAAAIAENMGPAQGRKLINYVLTTSMTTKEIGTLIHLCYDSGKAPSDAMLRGYRAQQDLKSAQAEVIASFKQEYQDLKPFENTERKKLDYLCYCLWRDMGIFKQSSDYPTIAEYIGSLREGDAEDEWIPDRNRGPRSISRRRRGFISYGDKLHPGRFDSHDYFYSDYPFFTQISDKYVDYENRFGFKHLHEKDELSIGAGTKVMVNDGRYLRSGRLSEGYIIDMNTTHAIVEFVQFENKQQGEIERHKVELSHLTVLEQESTALDLAKQRGDLVFDIGDLVNYTHHSFTPPKSSQGKIISRDEFSEDCRPYTLELQDGTHVTANNHELEFETIPEHWVTANTQLADRQKRLQAYKDNKRKVHLNGIERVITTSRKEYASKLREKAKLGHRINNQLKRLGMSAPARRVVLETTFSESIDSKLKEELTTETELFARRVKRETQPTQYVLHRLYEQFGIFVEPEVFQGVSVKNIDIDTIFRQGSYVLGKRLVPGAPAIVISDENSPFEGTIPTKNNPLNLACGERIDVKEIRRSGNALVSRDRYGKKHGEIKRTYLRTIVPLTPSARTIGSQMKITNPDERTWNTEYWNNRSKAVANGTQVYINSFYEGDPIISFALPEDRRNLMYNGFSLHFGYAKFRAQELTLTHEQHPATYGLRAKVEAELPALILEADNLETYALEEVRHTKNELIRFGYEGWQATEKMEIVFGVK